MRPENVLLVDDNELILCSMHRYFKKEFPNVTGACTGEEAIVNVRQQFHHIIILDINLPGIDGWEVLEYVRRHSPESRVIIITSCCDDGIRQKALKRGAFEYLEKPFDFDELRRIIMKILSVFETYRRIAKPVEITFENRYRGLTYDLSPTGMIVLTAICFEQGATLDMTMHVPSREPIPLKAKVVTTADSSPGPLPTLPERPGVGVKYEVGLHLIGRSPAYSSFVNSLPG